MSQFQGRKVTDPKTRSSGYSELYGSAGTGLEKAWDTMGNVKSALRRSEHRMNEATKPALFDLEADMDFTVPVDRIPSYTITDSQASRQDKGMMVDKYGRSQHMKSKMSDNNGAPLRKVSRMDDKYTEDQTHFSKPYQSSKETKPYQSSSKDTASYRKAPDLDLKPVKYTDSAYNKTDSSYGSKFTDMTNLTNSQDIRGTERRFINDNLGPTHAKPASMSVKMNPVDVPVPSAIRSKTNPAFSEAKVYSSENGLERDVTFTLPGSGSSISKKIKRGLKDSDSMEKIREMIRKQRLNLSSSDGGEVSDNGSDKHLSRKPSYHHDNDPVIPRTYELYQAQEKPAPIIRKIAAGPKAPTYTGFNEVVTTVQTPDGNVHRDKQQRKEAKKEKVFAKMQVERQLQADAARKEHLLKAAKRKEAVKLEAEKQAKKPARVVATKKPSKYERKDIITTTSWRIGTNKVKQLLAEDGDSRHRSVSPPVKDTGPSKEAENKSHKLSDEAKSVLADLQSDKSDDEKEPDIPSARSRAPRKRTKSVEPPAKEEKIVKVRTYDKDTARQYIRKQKEERKKKEAKEVEDKKLQEERRKQKLDELNKKRMENLRSRSRSTGAHIEGGSQRSGGNVAPPRSKTGSGSDKENKRMSEESDSATLTDGASEEERTHSSKSKPLKTELEGLIDKYSSKGQQKGDRQKGDRQKGEKKEDLISKYLVLQQTGMTSEEIVMKYTQQAQAIREGRKPEPYDLTSSLPAKEVEPAPISRPYTAPPTAVVDNKAARIQAIISSGALLMNRLQLEAQKIHEQPTDKWAVAPEEAGYVGRYSRITGANQDYSVFSGSQLPGVNNVGRKASDHKQEKAEDLAATKIQAAYRGSHVRQAMAPYLHHSKYKKADDSDHSMLSDDTVTEGSDIEVHMEPSARLPIKLAKTEYCHGGRPRDDGPIDLLKPTKPIYRWDPPKADPFNILNVYDRKAAQARSQNLRSRRIDYQGYTPDNLTQNSVSTERSRSPQTTSYEDDFTRASSTRHSVTEGPSTVRSPRSKSYVSSKIKSPHRDEEERKHSKKDGSLSLVRSSRGQIPEGPEADSDLSQISSLTEEDSEIVDPLQQQSKATMGGSKPHTTGYGVPRMSPAALEQRLQLEINLLGGVDESLRQLTDVERTRAVSMAQQETVSLAQVLKARQQAQSRDMAQLQSKAKQEHLESALQLEQARRRAADATEVATHTIAQVRADSASSLQDSTKKLIETQAHAAKATAEAARQLAEHMGLPVALETQGTQYSRPQSMYSTVDGASSRADRTDVSQSYNSDSFTSDSYTKSDVKTVSNRKPKKKKVPTATLR